MTELHVISKEDELHVTKTLLVSGTASCRIQLCTDSIYRNICEFSFISCFVHCLLRKAEILCVYNILPQWNVRLLT